MIKRIRIRNFGSLFTADVELGSFTLLLGPNASGKSMFIRAVRTLCKILRSAIRGPKAEFAIDHATLDNLVSRGDLHARIRFEVWTDEPSGPPNYTVELGRVEDKWTVTDEQILMGGLHYRSSEGPFEFGTTLRGTISWHTPGQPPRHATLPYLVFPFRSDAIALQKIRPLLNLQGSVGVSYAYRVNPTDLTTPTMPPWVQAAEKPYTDTTGSGFTHTLQRWSQSIDGGKVFAARVMPPLRELFPHIVNVGFRGSFPRLFLEYETTRSVKAISGQLESDGVNLGLFLLSIPHIVCSDVDSSTAICLGIEEPEAGTHPHLQRQRLDLLRRIASGSVLDRQIQIIATSHSVDLVRWVRRDEAINVLRFVEHLGDEQGTVIHRLANQDDIDRVYQAYQEDAGSAWYSGAFGGNPELPPEDEG